MRRHTLPGVEALLGRFERAMDLGLACNRQFAEHAPGCGIEHGHALRRIGHDKVASHELTQGRIRSFGLGAIWR